MAFDASSGASAEKIAADVAFYMGEMDGLTTQAVNDMALFNDETSHGTTVWEGAMQARVSSTQVFIDALARMNGTLRSGLLPSSLPGANAVPDLVSPHLQDPAGVQGLPEPVARPGEMVADRAGVQARIDAAKQHAKPRTDDVGDPLVHRRGELFPGGAPHLPGVRRARVAGQDRWPDRDHDATSSSRAAQAMSRRANDSASNTARSAWPSPVPTSFTGTPSSSRTARTIPPLAVPSIFVKATPVTSTASVNALA